MSEGFDFSPTLRVLTECDGVKQGDVARAADCSDATVSRWKDGTQKPDVDELRRLRDCLRFPAWFRDECANATSAGRRPNSDEQVSLDADRDGKITIRDARLFARMADVVESERALLLEKARGRDDADARALTSDEFAEQLRLWNAKKDLESKEQRVLEIVAGSTTGGARRLL